MKKLIFIIIFFSIFSILRANERINSIDIYDLARVIQKNTKRIPNSEYCNFPAISPNKKLITFTKTKDRNSEIFVMNPDGTDILRLTRNSFTDQQSVFLNNENLIFISNREGNNDIFKLNLLSKKIVNLTNTKFDETNPYVSVDKKIYFCSNKSGKTQIYSMDFSGNNYKQVIINDYSDNFTPNLSPYGDKIVHSIYHKGKHKIIETNITNQVEKLVSKYYSEFYPIYSPTGNEMILVSTKDGNYGLYVKESNKEEKIRITNFSNNSYQPFWSLNGNYLIYKNIETGKAPYLNLVRIPKSVYNFLEEGEDDVHIFSAKYLVNKDLKQRNILKKQVYDFKNIKKQKKVKQSSDKGVFNGLKEHFRKYGNYYTSGALFLGSAYMGVKAIDSLKKQDEAAKSGDKDKSSSETLNTVKYFSLSGLLGIGALWTFFF